MVRTLRSLGCSGKTPSRSLLTKRARKFSAPESSPKRLCLDGSETELDSSSEEEAATELEPEEAATECKPADTPTCVETSTPVGKPPLAPRGIGSLDESTQEHCDRVYGYTQRLGLNWDRPVSDQDAVLQEVRVLEALKIKTSDMNPRSLLREIVELRFQIRALKSQRRNMRTDLFDSMIESLTDWHSRHTK